MLSVRKQYATPVSLFTWSNNVINFLQKYMKHDFSCENLKLYHFTDKVTFAVVWNFTSYHVTSDSYTLIMIRCYKPDQYLIRYLWHVLWCWRWYTSIIILIVTDTKSKYCDIWHFVYTLTFHMPHDPHVYAYTLVNKIVNVPIQVY